MRIWEVPKQGIQFSGRKPTWKRKPFLCELKLRGPMSHVTLSITGSLNQTPRSHV